MASNTAGDLFAKVTKTAPRHLQLRHLVSGSWFHDLIVAYLHARARHAPRAKVQESERVRTAERIIRKACAEAVLLGTGTAAISTGASAWTVNSQGVAALIAVPSAGAAMLTDMLTRAFVMLKMSCDIAELFAVTFDPDDPSDLACLHAVAHRAVLPPEDGDDRGHDALDHLVNLGPEEISRAVGASSGTETLLRNVVPVVGLLTSGLTSYRVTRRLGETALQYARARRALDDALAPLRRTAPQLLDLLVEGVWFVFTSSGQLDTRDQAVLSHLLHSRPADVRRRLLDRMRDDEAGWLGRLREVPVELREDFMNALCVAAEVDTEHAAGERQLLERAARALSVPLPERLAASE